MFRGSGSLVGRKRLLPGGNEIIAAGEMARDFDFLDHQCVERVLMPNFCSGREEEPVDEEKRHKEYSHCRACRPRENNFGGFYVEASQGAA